MSREIKIFAIYTSEDAATLQQLLDQLKPSVDKLNVSIWHDDAIDPKQPWKPKIQSRFDQTDIFLLFVSNAFMHSEFIQQLEFKMVIDQYKEGKSKVIPILLENCPWDIDFNSDDYNFSFKELAVLPEERTPIKEWESQDKVYNKIAASIKTVITSLTATSGQEEPEVVIENQVVHTEKEEQIALSFNEEKEFEEEKRRIEEIASKRRIEEDRRKQEETTNKAAEEQRRIEEVESKRRIEENRRKQEEERNKAAEEQRHREAIAAKQSAEEQQLRALAETERLAKAKIDKEEVKVKRQAEQEKRIEEKNKKKLATGSSKELKEAKQVAASGAKKRIRIGAVVAVCVLLGIWLFTRTSDKQIESLSPSKIIKIEDSIALEKTEAEPLAKEEVLSELTLGEFYEGGIIFTIDANSKKGKIVHIDDAGPMTWNKAMKIHEQLGEGWRLPTFEELVILYKTVGQGAANSAEFANGLYWSATPFDEYQARLLQFRDGNTSYHYNKNAEHRKFRVRAVREFSQ